MGATHFECMKDVLIFKYSKTGIIGSIILALGRAFGGAMAVAFLLGGAVIIPQSIFEPATSIPVTLALQFGEAMGDEMYLSVMFYLAFILFLISFITIAIAKFMFLRR